MRTGKILSICALLTTLLSTGCHAVRNRSGEIPREGTEDYTPEETPSTGEIYTEDPAATPTPETYQACSVENCVESGTLIFGYDEKREASHTIQGSKFHLSLRSIPFHPLKHMGQARFQVNGNPVSSYDPEATEQDGILRERHCARLTGGVQLLLLEVRHDEPDPNNSYILKKGDSVEYCFIPGQSS